MGEAGDAAERVDEGGVWEKVGVECLFLVRWRSFRKEVNNVGDLTF